MPAFLLFSACGGTDDTPIDEGNNTENKTVEELATLLGGEGGFKIWEGDSVVWLGTEWWQAKYNTATNTFDPEEEVTNDGNYNFTKHKIWFKHDQYQSERNGYPLGRAKWTDPLGSTGLNYEFEVGNTDIIFVNKMEEYPPAGGRQDWTLLKLDETTFSFEREWRYGGEIKKDRFVWTKKQ